MKKIKPQTTDITAQNIDQIAQLFPQVIIEKEDASGNTVKAIDFEALKQHLSKDIVEGSEERYRLDWPGKRASILKANTPITTTLKPDRDSSVNFDSTENLYIEGDNFEVLKVLQESYLGKIKMIYIDPPYNTGKDFVYKDNFKVSKEDYENDLGTEDEDGGKLFKNTDTNGRFHSDWLSMMYERLLVARDLLTDDGVIFMSIDDNEVHNLRKLADEVFGEENFLAQVIWERAFSPVNLKKHFSPNHDYIITYSKMLDELDCNGLKRSEENLKGYKNPDNDQRGLWTSGDLNVGPIIQSKVYEITTPSGRKLMPASGYCWRLTRERFEEFKRDNRIWFGEDGDNVPRLKRFLNEVKSTITPMTIWNHKDVGHSQDASQKLKHLFDNGTYFDYPKPVGLISRALELYSNDNSLILDFFSGSATTAHATMQLNAEDGGNRKFIMVQLPEGTDKKSDAFKAGYKTIPEIGRERIRRASKQILKDNPEALKKRTTPLDVGFRVYKTSQSILKEVAKHPNDVTQTALFDSQDNIKEDASDEDILTSVILDFGETLDHPIEKKTIAGSTIFVVDTNALAACFDKDIDMAVVDAMAKLQPLRAVFRDACFKDDKDLINTVESRFKQLAPHTQVHVI